MHQSLVQSAKKIRTVSLPDKSVLCIYICAVAWVFKGTTTGCNVREVLHVLVIPMYHSEVLHVHVVPQ